MAKEMRTCIKEFLQHVETLEKDEDPEGCGINREYRLIHELQLKNRRENVFKSDAGKENLTKNRYKDIMPYDDHRVILNTVEDEEGSDYINASLIKGVKGSGGYIASQGPLASTVDDFWRMIWEKNVEIVFMACRIVELGKIKCKQYWNDVGESDDFRDINVLTESEENVSSDFIKRVFTVTRGEDKRTVIHYHYSGWPDHGIPDDPAHIRDLIAIMRQKRKKVDVPIVVHCSAGCGRTGAIIAIDYVWTLLEEGKLDEQFSLYELICKFREQRMSIVQTPDQYALVYQVLKSLCEDWLAKMASHTYVNVEMENEYVNFGDIAPKPEEEHVYEDNIGLMENLNDVKSSPSKSTGSPPKIENSNESYVNVQISNNQQQEQHSSKPTPPADSNEQVLHKTVIQIGTASKKSPAPTIPTGSSSSSSPSSNASVSSSGKKEVVNLIRSDSTVLRQQVVKSMSVPAPADRQARSESAKKSASVHAMGVSANANSRLAQVPDTPPGFNERLPKVRGPVKEPAHWTPS